jgi:hypothetical protein
LISGYIGGVATTQPLVPAPHSISCKFANSDASKSLIVNIGSGNAANFASLLTALRGGGRTITMISGLGSSAFSFIKNGIPNGLAVLTARGLVFSVAANLSLAQEEALFRQLMT